jgi:hypothetical protein
MGMLVLAAVALVGCDSETPAEVEALQADVFFSAAGAEVPTYAVWEVYPDFDDDGNPDDLDGDGNDDISLYCQQAVARQSVPDAPWAYSAQIKVLVAGEISARTIVSSIVSPAEYDVPERTNITPYDTAEYTAAGDSDDLSATVVTLDISTGSCSENTAVFCDPDNPGDVCDGLGFCRRTGACNGDPAVTCIIAGTSATSCTAPGSGCDCTELDDFPPIGVVGGWGTCCTAADIPSADCPDNTWLNHCSVTGNSGVAGQLVYCAPGCTEMGAGDECAPQEAIFKFRDRRILSGANREVLAATTNFINELDPDAAPTDVPAGGVCPGEDYGEPGIQGEGQPYSVTLGKGDTLLVEARRLLETPDGMVFSTDPSVNSRLFIDGKPIASPDGSVTTSEGGDPGGGAIDYRYSAR